MENERVFVKVMGWVIEKVAMLVVRSKPSRAQLW